MARDAHSQPYSHLDYEPSFFFFFFFFFNVDNLKVFTEIVAVLFLSYVLGFWAGGIGNLSSLIQAVPPALEGKVLTTGLPGKSLNLLCKMGLHTHSQRHILRTKKK